MRLEGEYWKWLLEDPEKVHVSFFGENNSSWVPVAKVKPFIPDKVG